MSPKLPFNKTKILVVDPQKNFQFMMKGMLFNFGAKDIDFAESGEAAVRLSRASKYDLYLVEYSLGPNKNGRQLLEELKVLRLLKPDAMFVIISSESSRAIVLGTLEHLPDDYIIKPFSQRLLSHRLQRAWEKRKALSAIHHHLHKGNDLAAIEACQKLIDNKNRYSGFCLQMMAELYCKTSQYNKAHDLLEGVLRERDLPWAKLGLARACLGQNRIDESLEILTQLTKKQAWNVEAYDLTAQALAKQNKFHDAQEVLARAVEISPLSIPRQKELADTAERNQDYPVAKECYQKILQLSRKSIHTGLPHLCNYLRSIIKAIENCEEKQDIHRMQQDLNTALFQAKTEEARNLDFSFASLEGIMQAQLHSAKGENIKAKKTLMDALEPFSDEEEGWDIPTVLTPDTCATLINLCDYDMASEVSEQLDQDDEFSRQLLKKLDSDEIKNQKNNFSTITHDGITAYSQGSTDRALDLFQQALAISPVNSGAALNLIQAQLRKLKETRRFDHDLFANCKDTFRLLNGVQLNENHRNRYRKLKQEFSEIKPKPKR